MAATGYGSRVAIEVAATTLAEGGVAIVSGGPKATNSQRALGCDLIPQHQLASQARYRLFRRT